MELRRLGSRLRTVSLFLILHGLMSASGLGAQTPDDDFRDFRIPSHRTRQGAMSVQGYRAHDSNTFDGEDHRRVTGSGTLSGRLLGFLDSERSQHVWMVTAAFTGGRQYERRISESPGFRDEREPDRRRTQESWFVSARQRWFLGPRPLAVGASGVFGGDYGQHWDREHQRVLTPSELVVRESSDDVDQYAYRARLTLEAGVGRVRNATGIYDAYVLEQRLRATGVLTRPLSRAARQKLAALHYAAPAYGAGTDRPDKFFWRDVERALREDGALRESGLDAHDVLRVLESRHPANVTRWRGVFVGPVIVGEHLNQITRFESADLTTTYVGGVPSTSSVRGSSRFQVDDDQILPGLAAEAHRPLGWRTQVDVAAFVAIPVLHVEKGLQARGSGQVAWFVHDRWLAAVEAGYARDYRVGDPGRASFDAWTASYGATLVYFLQDRLSVDLEVLELQRREAPIGPGSGATRGTFSRSGTARVGTSYGFWRGFDAPGLTDPVRPLSHD